MPTLQDAAYGFVPFVIRDGKPVFLLILHQKGHWAFPKGHAEGGETPLQTAQRELQEETGLQAQHIFEETEFTEEYTFTAPSGELVHKVNTFWLAEMPHQEVRPQAEEVADYVWLEFAAAQEQMTFESGRKSLAEAQRLFDKYVRLE